MEDLRILAYMAFCEVSQDQSPGTPAAAGDFGFKVLTSSDPAEKTKKLQLGLQNATVLLKVKSSSKVPPNLVCSELEHVAHMRGVVGNYKEEEEEEGYFAPPPHTHFGAEKLA